MRKRTINHLSDTIMWYLIYLLPLLVVLISLIHNSPSDVLSFVNTNFAFLSDNFVYSGFMEIFGEEGVLPLFTGNWSLIINYFVYFVGVSIAHLFVDFLVFIPRLAHTWMEKFTGGSNE